MGTVVVSSQSDGTKETANRIVFPHTNSHISEDVPCSSTPQRYTQWPIWKGLVCKPFRVSFDRTRIEGDEDQDSHVVCVCFFQTSPTES